jgi:hypothetical protein
MRVRAREGIWGASWIVGEKCGLGQEIERFVGRRGIEGVAFDLVEEVFGAPD